jgi:hypothetical protein
MCKQVILSPHGQGGGSTEQESPDNLGIDLRDRKACQKPVFAGLAKMLASPSEMPVPSTIPSDLQGAGEHWLLLARRKMNKASFRVIPSKIRRFVDVVGGDLPVAKLSAKHWKTWTEWLRNQVATGWLETATAQVNYNRAKELVKWLGEKGLVKWQIDGRSAKEVFSKN